MTISEKIARLDSVVPGIAESINGDIEFIRIMMQDGMSHEEARQTQRQRSALGWKAWNIVIEATA